MNKPNESQAYFLPPQNIEAEESILSAMINNNDAILDVLEILKPDDFYKTAHQKILNVIIELFNKNEPVDAVTLANSLKEKNEYEEIGGASYLGKLLVSVPRSVNVPYHAKIIREKALLRRLITKSNDILKKCYEDAGDVEEVIEFAEKSVFDVSEDKVKKSFYQINELIIKNIDTLEERQGNKALVTGIETGFSKLDQMLSGLQKSDLIILAARPSMGKTALALNMARNAAVKERNGVAVFSLEMSKEQLSMRLLCSEARVDASRLRTGFFSHSDWNQLTNAAGVLSEAPIYIDDTPGVSALEIRTKSRRLMMDKGIGLIVIDYIQLMQGRTGAERRDLEVSEISRSLKGLAKELNVPVIALSQLNRMLEQRSDKRPQLSDLRESGALEQDADVVMFIYRDEVYNKDESNPNKGTAEVIIAKQRNGPVGTVPLAFLGQYTRFEDLALQNIPDGY